MMCNETIDELQMILLDCISRSSYKQLTSMHRDKPHQFFIANKCYRSISRSLLTTKIFDQSDGAYGLEMQPVPGTDRSGLKISSIFSWIFGQLLQKSRVEILCFAYETSSFDVYDKVY